MTELTKITTPPCFLPEETREKLKAHKKSGGKVQVLLLTGEWVVASKTFWNPGRVYRAKPEPLELWVNEYPGHRAPQRAEGPSMISFTPLPELPGALAELGISASYPACWRRVVAGQIPARKFGRSWFYDPAKMPEIAASFIASR